MAPFDCETCPRPATIRRGVYFQCAPESEDDDGHDRIPTDEDMVFIVADNYNLAAMRNSPLRSQGVLIDGRSNIDDGVAGVVNSDKVT